MHIKIALESYKKYISLAILFVCITKYLYRLFILKLQFCKYTPNILNRRVKYIDKLCICIVRYTYSVIFEKYIRNKKMKRG